MSKIRLFGFGVAIIFVESLVQGVLVLSAVLLFPLADYTFKGYFSFFAFVSVFIYYKVIFEQWLFFLISFYKSKVKELTLIDLIFAKAGSASFLMFILVLFAFDSSKDGFGISALYATSFIPAILLSYFFTFRFWIFSVDWINKV